MEVGDPSLVETFESNPRAVATQQPFTYKYPTNLILDPRSYYSSLTRFE